jgi:cold shock protein
MAQYTGTVKSFNVNKGFGFIECAAAGTDVFFMKSDLNGFGASKGDQITFTLTTGEKGAKAVNCQVFAGADGSQTFIGEVKSYNQAKGFGFLSSTAATQLYGKDVFFMKTHIANNEFLAQGTQVQFKASLGEKGPIASEVRTLGGGGAMGGMGAWGMQWGGLGMWGGAGSFGAFGAAKAPKENEVFIGTVKKVDAEKGWGIIECGATQKTYGKDMFVHKTNIESSGAVEGAQVTFTVGQGAKGPHAENIKFAPSIPAGVVYSGSVKNYNDTKGWGFIDSPDAKNLVNADVFFHKNDITPGVALKAGDSVQFTLDISSGRAAGKNVSQGYGSMSPATTTARASPY